MIIKIKIKEAEEKLKFTQIKWIIFLHVCFKVYMKNILKNYNENIYIFRV